MRRTTLQREGAEAAREEARSERAGQEDERGRHRRSEEARGRERRSPETVTCSLGLRIQRPGHMIGRNILGVDFGVWGWWLVVWGSGLGVGGWGC